MNRSWPGTGFVTCYPCSIPGSGSRSPSVSASTGCRTPAAALLHPHGSLCSVPTSPWGGIVPAPSLDRAWGCIHPACSHNRAPTCCQIPHHTPESSSCAASAHPHTHTVPGPCLPGSHAHIILGAVPRHETAPCILTLLAPCSSFSLPSCIASSSTRGLEQGVLCNGSIPHPAGICNAPALFL